MRWRICVFAAGEKGRPRPWASFGDLTVAPLGGDPRFAETQPYDLAVAYLPMSDADRPDDFVRAVVSRHPLIVVLNEHRADWVVRYLDLGADDVVSDSGLSRDMRAMSATTSASSGGRPSRRDL